MQRSTHERKRASENPELEIDHKQKEHKTNPSEPIKNVEPEPSPVETHTPEKWLEDEEIAKYKKIFLDLQETGQNPVFLPSSCTKELDKDLAIGNLHGTLFVMRKEKLASKRLQNHEYRNVTLGQNLETGKLCIFKIREGIPTSNIESINSAEKEVRILSKLNRHVASLNNVAQDGSFYIVEEFAGESLDKLLKEETQTILDRTLLAIKIAKALLELHDKKILHRDIKLENILLDSSKGLIAFCDFEISLEANDELKAMTPDFFFTPGLLPPELLSANMTINKGYMYSNKTDVYLLGLILPELLGITDELTKSPRVKLNLFTPKSLSNEDSETLNELGQVCKKMTEEKPEARAELVDVITQLETIYQTHAKAIENKVQETKKISDTPSLNG